VPEGVWCVEKLLEGGSTLVTQCSPVSKLAYECIPGLIRKHWICRGEYPADFVACAGESCGAQIDFPVVGHLLSAGFSVLHCDLQLHVRPHRRLRKHLFGRQQALDECVYDHSV